VFTSAYKGVDELSLEQLYPTGGHIVLERFSGLIITLGFAIAIGGCASASSRPAIPLPEEVPRVTVGGPYFVESRDGSGFSCSTWAGSKLWLKSDDFGTAVSRTLELAQARVVTDPSIAKYVLSFGGTAATVNYEIREPGSDVVVWRTSKPWPNRVGGCALCCTDHARSHFEWFAEDLAAWGGSRHAEH